MEITEKSQKNETVETITINYEENGVLLVKQLKKEILSKGAWATLMFLYQEFDKANNIYKPPKVSLRRFQKKSGNYIQRSKFNISGQKQAIMIAKKISEWYKDAATEFPAADTEEDAEA